MCMYTARMPGALGAEVIRFPELELQMIVATMLVLGIEPRKAASALF